jgi:hypothetical protein
MMHWNNIKTTLLLFFFALAGMSITVQAQDWDDWDDLDDAYVPARKGIEFALNFGVYQGNHKAANAFYNGYAGEVYDLGDNTASLMTIEQRLGLNASNSQVWSQVMNSIGLEAGEFKYIEYPGLYGMRYSPGTLPSTGYNRRGDGTLFRPMWTPVRALNEERLMAFSARKIVFNCP